MTQIALRAKSHWDYPARWIEIWTPQLTFTARYLAANESWAAQLEDGPVGFYTLLDRNGMAWLENLWVLPEHIGTGIGRALFLHAAGLAAGRGYKLLQLEADPNAAGFYERMGMHQVGERRYEVDGQPRVLPVMEMEL